MPQEPLTTTNPSAKALSVPTQSILTEQSVVNALRDVLPSMHVDTATLKMVIEKLAVHFDVEFAELKAQWRPHIKAVLPDLIGLCATGCATTSDAEPSEGDEDEEEALDLRPKRTRSVQKRHAVVDEEDEDGEVGDSETSEGHAVALPRGGSSDDVEDDEGDGGASAGKRRPAPRSSHKRKRESKKVAVPDKKKSKTAKLPDPAGLALLKELGRAAGVLNPRVYKMLKDAASTTEAEEVLRDRLLDAGVSFVGLYPSSRDISAAKRKKEKERELEGIDTSLIIGDRRSRRAASQRTSYSKERISSDKEAEKEGDELDNDDKESTRDDDSATCVSDASDTTF